jgi:hypothetical protein
MYFLVEAHDIEFVCVDNSLIQNISTRPGKNGQSPEDDIIILCQTKRQLERAKQRLMDILHERRLRLSRKKTRIGSIDKGFHFLGINYLEPQPRDGTNVTQVSHDSTINYAYCLTSVGGWAGLPKVEQTDFAQERYAMHANKLNKWLMMGFIPAESRVT